MLVQTSSHPRKLKSAGNIKNIKTTFCVGSESAKSKRLSSSIA